MKSFLSDRTRINPPAASAHLSSTVNAFAPGAVVHPAPKSGESCAAPQIDCVRQGDRVTRLVVTCGCGERIEIDCLYAPGK